MTWMAKVVTRREIHSRSPVVTKAYRLYRQKLLTAKQFADVTGECLYRYLNYQEKN